MNSQAHWGRPVLLVALAFFMLLECISASGAPVMQNAAAVRATEDATKWIQENRLQEALEALDRAIDEDGEYWEAHYQRGRALGLLSRWYESRDALLRATELNPGHGHSHLLASMAAINVEDWDIAWDQAIKAQFAGEDMTQTLLNLYEMSPPPDDLTIRISAATVFVADVDTASVTADVELPTNFNPNAVSGTGERQGRASNLEDSALSQSSLDLIRLHRAMRSALASSPRLAVVLDPGRAQFIMAMQITEISTSTPYSVKGYFRLIDIVKQEVVYRQPIEISNLESTPVIVPLLRRYVTDMSAWLAQQEGGGQGASITVKPGAEMGYLKKVDTQGRSL